MQILTLSDFSRRVGRVFDVRVKGGSVALKLGETQELPRTARQGGAFRLEFFGPVNPILPQATYAFAIDGDRFEIFIVPLGQDARGTRYEALFL